jgi:hypothetical protein
MITCESIIAGIGQITGEALAASFGAFAGAGAAFALQMLHEKRLKADKEYAAIIRAQHALLFMSENLTEIRGQKLDAHKDHGLASIKWTPIQAALMSFSFCLFSKATGEI